MAVLVIIIYPRQRQVTPGAVIHTAPDDSYIVCKLYPALYMAQRLRVAYLVDMNLSSFRPGAPGRNEGYQCWSGFPLAWI